MAKKFRPPFGLGRSRTRCRPVTVKPPAGLQPAVYSIEPLEARLVLSASLSIQNMDGLPGPERLIFNRIQIQPPPTRIDPVTMQTIQPPNNVVHDQATLRLSNTGDQPLTLSSPSINGPWQIVGTFPSSIDPGTSADVTVKFTAQSAPSLPYNETNGTTSGSRAGAWVGSLTFNTNDPNQGTAVEELAGWWQRDNENNEEPSLQSVVNLVSNFQTVINPTHVNILDQPGGQKKYYGEEVISGYWQAADPSRPVGARDLASFHTQGNPAVVSYYDQRTGAVHGLFTVAAADGQSFLPHAEGKSTPAQGSFSSTGTFGFRIDQEKSDDALNPN